MPEVYYDRFEDLTLKFLQPFLLTFFLFRLGLDYQALPAIMPAEGLVTARRVPSWPANVFLSTLAVACVQIPLSSTERSVYRAEAFRRETQDLESTKASFAFQLQFGLLPESGIS